MARGKAKNPGSGENRAEDEGALPVSDAADGGTSRLSDGYSDNPDKPDPSSVAQVENLRSDEAADEDAA